MRTPAMLLVLPLGGIVGCDVPTEPADITGGTDSFDRVSSPEPVLFPSGALLAAAQSTAFTTIRGTIGPGAEHEIAMPAGPWNGELVVFAHGIVSPYEPPTLPDVASLADLVAG